ncbi:MAG TPA: thiamine phosphate synthase [Vicinamibacterales bacterium]|nr:thiamine phosphate synthase [Vicinamibacterales bacterium]
MILHLVSDRRRLAPGAEAEAAARCLLEQARCAVAAGLDVIQLREPDLDGRSMVALGRALVRATRGSCTRIVINDRLDVALAARADGLHLTAVSVDATAVRACTRPGFLIGRSVHAPAEAATAGPVDYLIAGAVWPTVSKPPGHQLLGEAGLGAVVAAAAVPVLAIGGVHVSHVARVAALGGSGVAAIGAWMGTAGACHAVPLADVAQSFRESFAAGNMEPRLP